MSLPDLEKSPSGVAEDFFLRAKNNYRTEESFLAVVNCNGWEKNQALSMLLASLIRLQCQGRANWVSRSFQSDQLNAIVSEWNWKEFIPWITPEFVSGVQCNAAGMALTLCQLSDEAWIDADILNGLWSGLAATQAQISITNEIKCGADALETTRSSGVQEGNSQLKHKFDTRTSVWCDSKLCGFRRESLID